MRWVFAAGLVVGFGLLLLTLVLGLNRRVRVVTSVLTAFGIAGLSAAYAGWPLVAATGAALVAAGFFGWYATVEE